MSTKIERIAVVSVGPGLWLAEIIVNGQATEGDKIELSMGYSAIVLSIKIKTTKIDTAVAAPF